MTGAGVAKVNGFPVFVQNALPGESGQVKVIKVKKGYAFGKLIKHHTISEQRVEAPCPVYKQCGGCQLQHVSYEGQLQFKQKQVKDVMARIGHLPDVPVHSTLGIERSLALSKQSSSSRSRTRRRFGRWVLSAAKPRHH